MNDLPVTDLARSTAPQPARAGAGSEPRPAAPAGPHAPPEDPDLKAAVAETLEAVAHRAGVLEFQVDQGQAIVRVVDRETNQLIRQIPSVEMLELRRALERAAGAIIRSKA